MKYNITTITAILLAALNALTPSAHAAAAAQSFSSSPSNPVASSRQPNVAASPWNSETDSESGEEIYVLLNGLNAVTDKVIPALIVENGLDSVEHTMVTQGTLTVKNWFDRNELECAKYQITINMAADLPVAANDVSAEFKTDRVVDTNWDVGNATLSGVIDVELENGANANNFYCIASWESVAIALENVIGTTRIPFSTEGLSGGLKVSLKEASRSVVAIESVQNADIAFDAVSITDSAAVNWLIGAGITIADLFGGSCSNLENCVNDMIRDELNDKKLLNDIKKALNDAIAQTATIHGGTDDTFDVEYTVSLKTLDTNGDNQFNTGWHTSLSGNRADDPCADDLLKSSYGTVSSETRGGDIDLTAGFSLIGNALFAIGKQGALCQTVSGSLNIADASEISPPDLNKRDDDGITSTSGRLGFSGTIVPDGAIVISDTARTANLAGIGSINALAAKDIDQRQINVSLPVRLDDFNWNLSGVPGGAAGYDDPISGDLNLTLEFNVSCENGLYLRPVSAALQNLSGSFTVGNETVLASDFEDALQEAATNLLAEIEAITILPKINSLDTLGLGLEIGSFSVDDSAVHIALNLTDDIACTP